MMHIDDSTPDDPPAEIPNEGLHEHLRSDHALGPVDDGAEAGSDPDPGPTAAPGRPAQRTSAVPRPSLVGASRAGASTPARRIAALALPALVVLAAEPLYILVDT